MLKGAELPAMRSLPDSDDHIDIEKVPDDDDTAAEPDIGGDAARSARVNARSRPAVSSFIGWRYPRIARYATK